MATPMVFRIGYRIFNPCIAVRCTTVRQKSENMLETKPVYAVLRKQLRSACHSSFEKVNPPSVTFLSLGSDLKLCNKQNISEPPKANPLQVLSCAQISNANHLILPSVTIGCQREYLLPNLSHQGSVLKLSLPSLGVQEKCDPLYHKWEIVEPTERPIVKKHAVRMLIIRKKKMKKHQLKKLRKKMRFVWARARLKREIKKEKEFQAELMAQIKAAEVFNAEEYVKGVLKKIKEAPRPETPAERRERIQDLMRKYRSHVSLIRPKFD